ncbi:MAG: tryptophan--tRNA ligase [Patescibacteria group bacterium]|nr:tryptophan--tRNA ligase [Patescibacteria group bacterium]
MKKTILTGLKPSGKLHIGHFLGLLQGLKGYIEDYDAHIFIADLHSLTELRDDYSAENKRKEIFEMTVDAICLGVDPEKCVFFTQSDISEHSELAWIFNCITPVSFLERMTQYKDKAAKNVKNINMGLMDYPVLQAADILLYDADFVPVGVDQVQHVELSRDIARFFNNKFGKTFKEPQPKLTNIPKVMSLTHPDKKMSKSDGEKSCIFLSDEPEEIMEKIKKAVADKVGLENLYKLGEIFISEFNKANYKDNNLKLKTDLATAIADHFADFRAKRKEWLKKDKEIEKILAKGAEKARAIASKKMIEVRKKVGLK